MLEEALNDVHRSPAETSRALLSFFRQEFPVGGTAAEARFVQFYPVLLDRILGPVIVHSLQSGGGGGGKDGNSGGLKPEELQAMEAAWLLYYRPWRSSSSVGSATRNASNFASSTGMKSGTGIKAPTRSGHGGGMHHASSSTSSLDHDSVVQLLTAKSGSTTTTTTTSGSLSLSSSSPTTTSMSTSRAPSFFQILHGGDNNEGEQLVILRTAQMSFPFTELPQRVQGALAKRVYRNMIEASTQSPHGSRSHHHHHYHQSPIRPLYTLTKSEEQSNAQKFLNTMSRSLFDQKELVQCIRQIISQFHNNGMETASHGHGHGHGGFHSQMGLGMAAIGSPRFGGASPQSTGGAGFGTGTGGSGGSGGIMEDVSSLERRAKVQLSLWEYYMMAFVRFGVVIGKMNKIGGSSSSGSSSGYRPRSSSSQGHGEKVYYHLLKGYMQFYFPHIFQNSSSAATASASKTPSSMDREMDSSNINTNVNVDVNIQKKEEFFMRLMIEYWMERNTYPTTGEAIAHHISSESSASATSSGINNNNQQSMGLDSSYDLAQLLSTPIDIWHSLSKSEDHVHGHGQNYHGQQPLIQFTRAIYHPASRSMRKCISMLVGHLMTDPAIARQCRHSTGKQGASTLISASWPLPTSHTILQTSLYNHIRTGLRYGPVHVQNSSFHAAMDLWLLWLEPWNVVQRKKTSGATMQAKELFHNVSDRVTHLSSQTSTSGANRSKTQYYTVNSVPKPNQASKYTSAWEAYVAANLHFYLVPLAIFLRRARELEFGKHDFTKSMNLLKKVIRVFSPQLCMTLERVLGNVDAADRNHDSDHLNTLKHILHLHEENLGEFCPARPRSNESRSEDERWSLSMLQQDMQNLLEEIVIKHQKTISEQDVFERIESKIEGLFGEGSKAKQVAIDKLISSARIIVKFPKDHEVIPSLRSTGRRGFFFGAFRKSGIDVAGSGGQDDAFGTADADSNSAPDREQNSGFISERGREQLLHGMRMCNAMDVNFVGDPMYSRPKSHEVKFLVKWSLRLSNALNVYFDLDGKNECKLYGEELKSDAAQLAREGEEVKKAGAFRFNLRFVADTRNWIMMFLVWKLFWRLLLG